MIVLVLSQDAVAAALLGGLVETLGYDVHFARAPESVEASIRRVRPRICLIDCVDPTPCSDEFLGRAAMRGISVVIFGVINGRFFAPSNLSLITQQVAVVGTLALGQTLEGILGRPPAPRI